MQHNDAHGHHREPWSGTPEHRWREHRLAVSDLTLAWFEVGSGPVAVLLNGGPGDDHRYVRAVAEGLMPNLRCVLFDQRGTGRSSMNEMTDQTLHVDRFLGDIEALRAQLGGTPLRLVGHSWGATLALLYAARYPRHVDRVALVGPGPLTAELAAVAHADLVRPLSLSERTTFDKFSARRRAALEEDLEAHRRAHLELVTTLYVRSWFNSPAVAAQFATQFRASYHHNPTVARHVLGSVDYTTLWTQLRHITAPMLVVYGHQDFEPVLQAYLLKQQMPQTRICLLNECGHLPWLKQPEAFFAELLRFIR